MSSTDFDICIIGSGPAGLQAAMHAARRKRSVVVLGRPQQSNISRGHLENYYGVEKLDGTAIQNIGYAQAGKFGAELVPEDAIRLQRDDASGRFTVTLETQREVACTALVIATGVSMARLGAKGEKEFVGRGVSYCVDCDANFFRQKKVAVIGDGSGAAEGARTMLSYASEVHLVAESLDVSDGVRKEIESSDAVMHIPGKAVEITGESSVNGLVLEDGKKLEVDGVFIELGARGVMELTMMLGVELDAESLKYIVTDRKQKTSIEGVFAAGDVTGGARQVAKAVGEGCVAGLSAAEYVRDLERKGGES